jgi:hypothetical protein
VQVDTNQVDVNEMRDAEVGVVEVSAHEACEVEARPT